MARLRYLSEAKLDERAQARWKELYRQPIMRCTAKSNGRIGVICQEFCVILL